MKEYVLAVIGIIAYFLLCLKEIDLIARYVFGIDLHGPADDGIASGMVALFFILFIFQIVAFGKTVEFFAARRKKAVR